jgi:hypothetical protein
MLQGRWMHWRMSVPHHRVPIGPWRRVSEMQATLHRGVNSHHGRHHGEPGAVRAARRVRRAAWETDQQQCRHRAPGRRHPVDALGSGGDRSCDDSGGRLGALRGQPGDLFVELPSVPGSVPGPGHRPDRGAMLGAVHPRRIGLQPHRDRPEVQGPPPPASLTPVVPRPPTPERTTTAPARPPGTHTRDQLAGILVELDALDDRLLDPRRARHKVAFHTPFSAHWFLYLDSPET